MKRVRGEEPPAPAQLPSDIWSALYPFLAAACTAWRDALAIHATSRALWARWNEPGGETHSAYLAAIRANCMRLWGESGHMAHFREVQRSREAALTRALMRRIAQHCADHAADETMYDYGGFWLDDDDGVGAMFRQLLFSVGMEYHILGRHHLSALYGRVLNHCDAYLRLHCDGGLVLHHEVRRREVPKGAHYSNESSEEEGYRVDGEPSPRSPLYHRNPRILRAPFGRPCVDDHLMLRYAEGEILSVTK